MAKHATCKDCGQEMSPGTACTFTHIKDADGKIYQRDVIGFGNKICHDCNSPQGGAHHYGCDEERCPICGGQLISCDCFVGKIILIKQKGEDK